MLRRETSPGAYTTIWHAGVSPSANSHLHMVKINLRPVLAYVDHDAVHASLFDSITQVDVLNMQTDGNLVLYRADNTPVWSSGTAGNPGAYARFEASAGTTPKIVMHNASGEIIKTIVLGAAIGDEKASGYSQMSTLNRASVDHGDDRSIIVQGQIMRVDKCLASGPAKLMFDGTGKFVLYVARSVLILGNDAAPQTYSSYPYAGVVSDALVIAYSQGATRSCAEVTWDMLDLSFDQFCSNAFVVDSNDMYQKCKTPAFECNYSVPNGGACLPSTGVTPGAHLDKGSSHSSCACMSKCDSGVLSSDSNMIATFAFANSPYAFTPTGYAIASSGSNSASDPCVVVQGMEYYTFNDSRAPSNLRLTTHGGTEEPSSYSGLISNLSIGQHGLDENPILSTYFGMCKAYHDQENDPSIGRARGSAALVRDESTDGCANAGGKWTRHNWTEILNSLQNIDGSFAGSIPGNIGCCTTTATVQRTNSSHCTSSYNEASPSTLGLNNTVCCRKDPFPFAADSYYYESLTAGNDDKAGYLACYNCHMIREFPSDQCSSMPVVPGTNNIWWRGKNHIPLSSFGF